MQPWEFIVLESDDIRKAAVATTYSGYFAGPDNQQSWMLEAAAIVAVCTNCRRTIGRYGERLAHHSVQDVAAATENLMITATEMGLGTCWVGGFKADEMTKLLGIPEGVQVLSMVAIGYPAQSPAPKSRLPLDMLTHRDRWGVPYFERGEK
jgi:nitroreductase